jgi:hypothetical protein
MSQRPEFVPRLKTGGPRVAPQTQPPRLSRDEAETIALRALSFMAEDEDRLGSFLGETGVDPDDLRQNAGSVQVLGAVLDYLSRDETLLLMFATNAAIPPEHIVPALAVLNGEVPEQATAARDPDRPSKIMRRR